MASPEPLLPAVIDADKGLVIIHTAAVAGRPRGALVSHANLLCASLHLNYCFGLSESDVHLNLLALVSRSRPVYGRQCISRRRLERQHGQI
jgi:acyl-CoA synthetase (AMP-forming)/AMP-acid ligase II